MDLKDNGEDAINQPLLPDDHEKSNEDIESDFKSCNSGTAFPFLQIAKN